MAALALGGDAVAPAAGERKPSDLPDWLAAILPRGLQKNPPVAVTVITELSEAGKKRPPVSPAQPVYYATHSNGYKQMGDVSGHEKTIDGAEMASLLQRALATNGYLPAHLPEHPPSLLVVYTWGTHNNLSEGDAENPTVSAEQYKRNLLDRAALVGGDKFARDLLRMMNEAEDLDLVSGAQLAPGGQPPMPAALVAFVNPINLFKLRGPNNEQLLNQTVEDVYYVIASAYDYRSVATDRKVLLWRTRMTVASTGVSQVQTLPTLVLTAAPYLGKEMTGPQILRKRAFRNGEVEIGTPTVVESAVPAPAPQKK